MGVSETARNLSMALRRLVDMDRLEGANSPLMWAEAQTSDTLNRDSDSSACERRPGDPQFI